VVRVFLLAPRKLTFVTLDPGMSYRPCIGVITPRWLGYGDGPSA
jgi:hypothetical protein